MWCAVHNHNYICHIIKNKTKQNKKDTNKKQNKTEQNKTKQTRKWKKKRKKLYDLV